MRGSDRTAGWHSAERARTERQRWSRHGAAPSTAQRSARSSTSCPQAWSGARRIPRRASVRSRLHSQSRSIPLPAAPAGRHATPPPRSGAGRRARSPREFKSQSSTSGGSAAATRSASARPSATATRQPWDFSSRASARGGRRFVVDQQDAQRPRIRSSPQRSGRSIALRSHGAVGRGGWRVAAYGRRPAGSREGAAIARRRRSGRPAAGA